MAIATIFQFMGEIVEVRLIDSICFFRTQQFGGQYSTIDGLKLDKKGVIKEHPDLIDKEDWREEAIKRFKDKIKQYKTQEEQMNYIQEDLKKYGYIPLYLQKTGFRPVKLN
jgi:hypothetical protein